MYDLTLTTIILSALNTTLLGIVTYLIKKWFEHVNDRIKALTEVLVGVETLKHQVEALKEDVRDVKDDMKSIRDTVTSHVTKATVS